MSLINEMLRNLEAKSPDDLLKQNLQREIRALPAEKSGRGPWFWRALLGVVMLLLAGFAAVQHQDRLQLMLGLGGQTPPPAQLAVPVVAPVMPVEPVAESATVHSEKTLISDSLLVARELAFVPQSPDILPPVIEPSGAVKTPEPVSTKAASDKLSVEMVRTGVVSGTVKIDKSPVLATPRDRAEIDYRKAEAATAEGRIGDSVELLKSALKTDPGHIQARQNLIRQLLELRKQEDAMRVLHDGLDLTPAQTGWAISLARLQMETGDLAGADRTLIHSQPFAESNAEYAGFQGHLKSRLGEHRSAAEYYFRASRLAPREGRWWLGLGLAFEADGKLPESKEAFRRSLASGNLSPELAGVAEQRLR
jgi:MSHA biogenesis protein MshN